VITRRQKLVAAGIVLAAGFALAWPLRRDEPLLPASARQAAPAAVQQLTQAVKLDRPAMAAASVAAPALAPVTPAAPTVYSTVSTESALAPPLEVTPTERMHIVHEGDSLDSLAKRYLGDEGRALEIFDLNREALENPHVLPLGVELRIPSGLTGDVKPMSTAIAPPKT
jgi:nucleoid-associated protein YgaU